MEPHGDQGPGARASREDSIDLARLLQAVRARKSWIVVPTLAAFVAGLVFVTLVEPAIHRLHQGLAGEPGELFHAARQSDARSRRALRPRGRPERGRDDRYGRSGAQGDRETRPDGKERIQSRDFAQSVFDAAVFAHGRAAQGERGRGPGRRKLSGAPDRFPYSQIAGAADRILERRSRARSSRRQRGRRPLPERKGRGQAESGQGRRGLAVRQDRRNCAPRSPRRTPRSRRFASDSGLLAGAERHDGALATTRRNHHPDRFGARRAIGRGGQGAVAARNVARGTARRGPRFRQGRVLAPLCGNARDIEVADRGGVGDAAARPSAHEGTQRTTRRPRRANSRRRRQGRAGFRGRGAAGGRAGVEPRRSHREASQDRRHERRRRSAIARARTRREDRARAAGILHR